MNDLQNEKEKIVKRSSHFAGTALNIFYNWLNQKMMAVVEDKKDEEELLKNIFEVETEYDAY